MVMKPIPPTNIMPRIMVWPERVQYVAVFSITNPVTVIADVAVNSAVMNGVNPLSSCVNGSRSNKVPTAIKPANMYTTRNGEASVLEGTLREVTV